MGGSPLRAKYQNVTTGSLFQTPMLMLKPKNVGGIIRGFVSGQTNTIFAWDTPLPNGKEPAVWFHDIYRTNGTPYSQHEVAK